jgi:peptide/nickel transport system permease protein
MSVINDETNQKDRFLMSAAVSIVARTVVFYCFVVLGATFSMYTLLWAAPGSVLDALCPKGCDEDMKKQLRKEWNLDRPLVVQYGYWLGRAVKFDFGKSVSFQQGAPISKLLGRAIRLTSVLVLGAAFLTLLLAFFMAWRPGMLVVKWLATMARVPLTLLSFVPLYILAYWAVICSSRLPHWMVEKQWITKKQHIHWLDIDLVPFGKELEWTNELGWLYLIPFGVAMLLLVIGNNNLVEQVSSLRAELDQLKQQHFMRAVRARGASFFLHLCHNMLLPVAQFFTTRAILLLGTVIIIESLLGITGVGWLLWEAAKMRDTPLVLAIALFATVVACILQMLNEIALKLIDPRLRRES